uniref:Uncharacterized protein n=1 Tax=Leersia perrieri TaxID=77586 RepID=A0A0D9VIE4_9ORYZ
MRHDVIREGPGDGGRTVEG